MKHTILYTYVPDLTEDQVTHVTQSQISGYSLTIHEKKFLYLQTSENFCLGHSLKSPRVVRTYGLFIYFLHSRQLRVKIPGIYCNYYDEGLLTCCQCICG